MKDYDVVQRKANKKWYVVGYTGYGFMPISNGMKSKREAKKYASIQKKVDKLAPCGL